MFSKNISLLTKRLITLVKYNCIFQEKCFRTFDFEDVLGRQIRNIMDNS